MTDTETLDLRIRLNVIDPEGVHYAALKAYLGFTHEAPREEVYGFDADALANAMDTLGTQDAPNLVNCFVELWAEHTPAEVGYEFVTYE